ncbi:hypothetical protein AVEN_4563-1 [Araneus ventricosus]|uniref:Uncharacterized protein n=1 Tax=Araneus ventricosus TaxID=182803 RepID=A0A4Y2BN63_ARAVE|nr:hypothetical protein AVEN_4563-1 [Araneus ventricosus]
MVWAAFSFNGQVGLAFLDGRQNSPKYIETLENHLMPFAENIGGRNCSYVAAVDKSFTIIEGNSRTLEALLLEKYIHENYQTSEFGKRAVEAWWLGLGFRSGGLSRLETRLPLKIPFTAGGCRKLGEENLVPAQESASSSGSVSRVRGPFRNSLVVF